MLNRRSLLLTIFAAATCQVFGQTKITEPIRKLGFVASHGSTLRAMKDTRDGLILLDYQNDKSYRSTYLRIGYRGTKLLYRFLQKGWESRKKSDDPISHGRIEDSDPSKYEKVMVITEGGNLILEFDPDARFMKRSMILDDKSYPQTLALIKKCLETFS